MHAKTLFAAACAASLFASLAQAQQTNPPHVDMPIGAAQGVTQPDSVDAGRTVAQEPRPLEAIVTPAPARDAATTAPTTILVTNGPVPDTPANRAAFGGPESNAGKKTAPVAN